MSDSTAAASTMPSALANPEGENEENVSMPPPVDSPASDTVVSESPASDPVAGQR